MYLAKFTRSSLTNYLLHLPHYNLYISIFHLYTYQIIFILLGAEVALDEVYERFDLDRDEPGNHAATTVLMK